MEKEAEVIRRKAFIYVRVSTKDQVEGASLEAQEEACRYFAENELNASVEKVYREEGESAKTANRTKLTELLLDAHKRRGDIDYVVFYDMSRMTRNIESYTAVVKAQLKKLGIEIRSVKEPAIDDSPMGHFIETITVGYAQLENEIRGVKVTDSMATRASQGYWVTQPPIGFKIKAVMPDGTLADSAGRKERVKSPKILVPDDTIMLGDSESVYEKISKLFYRFAEGDISLFNLHKMAIGMGLKSQDGRPIPFNSLRHILEHPVYAGYSKPGKLLKESIKFRFDGLVDRETFDRVQVLLNSRKRDSQSKNKTLYPLDGTILCECCGMPLHGDAPGDGSRKHHPRYYCRGGVKSGHGYISAKATDIHEAFNDFLQQVTPTEGTVRLFKEILKRTAIKRLGNVNTELEAIRRVEGEIDAKKNRALDSFLEGKISQEEKDSYTQALDDERLRLKERRMDAEKQQTLNEATIEYVCNLMDKPAKLWRDADLNSKRAFQQMLFPNGLHVDLKAKKCRTEDLSPLYSVICNKNEPNGSYSDNMVTLVETKWNDLVRDMYRIKGITSVIYLPDYIL